MHTVCIYMVHAYAYAHTGEQPEATLHNTTGVETPGLYNCTSEVFKLLSMKHSRQNFLKITIQINNLLDCIKCF